MSGSDAAVRRCESHGSWETSCCLRSNPRKRSRFPGARTQSARRYAGARRGGGCPGNAQAAERFTAGVQVLFKQRRRPCRPSWRRACRAAASAPSVVSLAVWCSSSALISPPRRTIDGREPDPGHEADRGAERAVGLVVVAEARDVPGEQHRADEPDGRGDAAAPGHPAPLRLVAARAVAIEAGEPEQDADAAGAASARWRAASR